jgi:hypothetical protein
LNEDIPVIGIGTHRSEDDWRSCSPEVTTRSQAGGIVINAAYHDFTRKVHSQFDGFFQTKAVANQIGRMGTLVLQIADERNGLVFANIAGIEPLPVQVTGLDNVVVEYDQAANAFADKRQSNRTSQTSGADQNDAAAGEPFLIETSNLLLPFQGPVDLISLKTDRAW